MGGVLLASGRLRSIGNLTKKTLARAKVYKTSLEDNVEQNAKSKLSERTGWSEEIA